MQLFGRFLPANSFRSRVARGAFWSLVATVSVQIASLVSSILAARILGQTGFGELGIIRSTVLMFGVLAGSGFGLASTKYVAELRDTNPARAGRLIGLLMNVAFVTGAGATLVCFALAPFLAGWAMNAPHLMGPLQFGCVMLLFNTLSGVQLGTIGGFEAFDVLARIAIIDAILNLVLVPIGAWVFGVSGAVGGLALASILAFPIKQLALKQICQKTGVVMTHHGVSAELPTLWQFALPSVLVGVSIQPFEWFARLLLSRQTNGFAELGIFTAAMSWGQLVMFIPQQILRPGIPILSNLYTASDAVRFVRTAIKFEWLIIGTGVLSAIPLMFLSPYIMAAYGTSFISGGRVLLILLLAHIIASATSLTVVFTASGRMWVQTLHYALWGGILVGAFNFLGKLGSLGLGISYVFAYASLLCIQLICFYKSFASSENINAEIKCEIDH